MRNKNKIFLWFPLIIGVSIAIGFYAGNAISERTSNIGLWQKNNTKLESIFDYINKAYVDTVDTNALVEKAIPAVISELDPHSAYISAEDMALTGQELTGHFSGIGVEFIVFSDTITIVNVIDGGPSQAAGLRSGDRVVTVNDTTFVGEDVSNDKVFRKLRGKKGSKVTLGIKRKESENLFNYEVTRADVPVKSVDVSFMLTNNIGYIKVNKFGETTYDDFISAIAKLKSKKCTSFIIDLQQNTGGYLGAAVKMVNEFLQSNELILYTEGRVYPRENIAADGKGICKKDQLVVLIDEGTASAAEIFSGAIQDHDRGLIVGRRSFGKGLVQSQHQFNDGSALRLTIARYHTPSGRCVQKKYERGKGAEYSKDIYNRYMRGEFDNRDSIKVDSLPLFHTVAGRKVYGDDGVLSDVFVPRDTIGVNSYYLKVANKGYLRDYAFSYADQNREKLKSFKNWKALAAYLKNEPLVNNLVAYAEQKGVRQRPFLIAESKQLMQTQLEALIVRYASFGDEGFYSIYTRDDLVIKKAIELINKGKADPKAVRTEQYKN